MWFTLYASSYSYRVLFSSINWIELVATIHLITYTYNNIIIMHVHVAIYNTCTVISPELAITIAIYKHRAACLATAQYHNHN